MRPVEGESCWRLARAERVAFLVDASRYFHALRAALQGASRRILILGWDLHSGIDLTPDDPEPTHTLADELSACAARAPELRVQIGTWREPWVLLLEREWFTGLRLRRRLGRRLAYRRLPAGGAGACHHTKLVVIDDTLAFVGGFDLTSGRWDLQEHPASLEARRDPWGTEYPPWHDVQLLVSGPLAERLAEHAQAFWARHGGEAGEPREPLPGRWPEEVTPDLLDAPGAVARTVGDRAEPVREIESCYEQLIAAAQRSIYLENQYFASPKVADWLLARLDEPEGPEIVLVLPTSWDGWLESAVMGSKCAHLLKRLSSHPNAARRFRVYEPVRRQESGATSIFVHSKLAIIDRDHVFLGSANFSNRSLGLDSELNVLLECATARAPGRAPLLDRLLAEHLSVSPEAFSVRMHQHGSLIDTIEGLRGGERTLEPIAPSPEDAVLDAETAGALDPERPVSFRRLAGRVLSAPGGPRRRMLGIGALGLATLIAGIAVAVRLLDRD
jgi:phosphatidylserine/phosphatidylglycerophosphate/cardiolipin synthase-like enzyme